MTWERFEVVCFGMGLGLLAALAGVSAKEGSYLVTGMCGAVVLVAVGWVVTGKAAE